MSILRNLVAPLTVALFTAGCATTGDPHADTIWYSRKKGEARLNALREQESDQSKAAAEEKAAVDERKRSLVVYDAEAARLAAQLDQTGLEIVKLRRETLVKGLSSEGSAEINALQQRLADTRKQLEILRSQESPDVEAVKSRLAELGAERMLIQKRLLELAKPTPPP